MKTYLHVPYAYKDYAKARGARFDMSRKQWYCPDGVDLMLFKAWIGGVGNRKPPSPKKPSRAELRKKKRRAKLEARKHPERIPSTVIIYKPEYERPTPEQMAHLREILAGEFPDDKLTGC